MSFISCRNNAGRDNDVTITWFIDTMILFKDICVGFNKKYLTFPRLMVTIYFDNISHLHCVNLIKQDPKRL